MSRLLRFSMSVSMLLVFLWGYGQEDIQLQVLSAADSLPVVGATVSSATQQYGQSNGQGWLTMRADEIGQMLRIRHVGFQEQYYTLGTSSKQRVYLLAVSSAIEEVEVVETGYFSAPKERLSGSFVHIDNKLLNRSSSSNLLDRLEGITNGLQFDRGNLSEEDINGNPTLRVRGASTLVSDARPLVIVDDFPFDGDLRHIDPNEVESVTILKDASAASIWGTRAGNGVLVINMKKGTYERKLAASFSSSMRVTAKPDLFYSQSVLLPETVMDMQETLFNNKAYSETDIARVPLYVELLIKKRDNLITDEEFAATRDLYLNSDIRADASRYLYRPAVQQQYSLGLRGGEKGMRYSLSAGYDRQQDAIVGQHSSRRNLALTTGMRLFPGMELEGIVRYTAQLSRTNAFNRAALEQSNIYLPLADAAGNSLPVPIAYANLRYSYQEKAESLGLLDWMYRPLDEPKETRFDNNTGNTTLGFTANYQIPIGIKLRAIYYYNQQQIDGESFYSAKSYFARDLINKYTQADGSKVVPDGAVLRYEAPRHSVSHSLRLQGDYTKSWQNSLRLDALAGMEGADQRSRVLPSSTLLGYDPDTEIGTPYFQFGRTPYLTRPNGTKTPIPLVYADPATIYQRNLSVFSNFGLSWQEQYVLNGSLRWDGSNLLGVKTNAKGVALWSTGFAWNMHKASFYRLEAIDQLKLRLSYGSAGNIDKSQSHLPVITKRTSTTSGVPYASLNSPGNPSLRWEQVNTFNAGVDWSFRKGLLSGTIEYYSKQAKHLLNSVAIDPTIGVSDGFMMNYAQMHNQGLDLSLQNSIKLGLFQIDNYFLFNYTANKVTKVNSVPLKSISNYINYNYFTEGESRDVVYSYPWLGLNPANGLPLMQLSDGSMTEDAKAYIEGLRFEDLIRSGLKVAPIYGSYRLGIRYQGFQASTLLLFKAGHVARRRSYLPGRELDIQGHIDYHMDYYKRWQKPGDELITDVPATPAKYDSRIKDTYAYSEFLITPLDHIALRDVTLSYSFKGHWMQRVGVKGLELSTTVQNVGLLWKKNTVGLHPEYPNTTYPAGRQFYLALRVNL
ncbi:SusC/RagA family TonB-linked outer membrane protein [Sphingobacterium faecale]|uniref:SusC/RagA family TonB-linked outer membrane protein n=1 Tax=Sphingobacterium faecale TaxID=2803775 RepID=A0ABS1RAE3_9SPHI|nr:SusC/RagA family TonB-linked outer membrane protein [Sphingobacterium faecale]MBL1410801.1 SusC/RagA family TonB-linked outer membrane protein [Sphingobacterium faecale]